jgi:hypothetical protein
MSPPSAIALAFERFLDELVTLETHLSEASRLDPEPQRRAECRLSLRRDWSIVKASYETLPGSWSEADKLVLDHPIFGPAWRLVGYVIDDLKPVLWRFDPSDCVSIGGDPGPVLWGLDPRGRQVLADNRDRIRSAVEAFRRCRATPKASSAPPVPDTMVKQPETNLTPGNKAIAAALDLKREGLPVSLKAACERAGVDRANIRRRYPDAVKAIRALSVPDGVIPRATRDSRTGDFDVVDETKD